MRLLIRIGIDEMNGIDCYYSINMIQFVRLPHYINKKIIDIVKIITNWNKLFNK